MQTGTKPTSDVVTPATSPRSAKRVLLYLAIGIPVALTLLVLLIYAFSSDELTPLEQKLHGRWVGYPSYGNRTFYTFREDGTFVMHDESSPSNRLKFRWSAAGSKMQTYEPNWIIHLWNQITGKLNRKSYEVLLHDEHTMELSLGPPTGETILRKLEADRSIHEHSPRDDEGRY